MKKQNYQRQIKILIENSVLNDPHDLISGFHESKLKQDFSKTYDFIAPLEEKWSFHHKQILAIKAMFEQSSKQGRKAIVENLESYFESSDLLSIIVVIKTLAYIGQIDIILDKTIFSFNDYHQKLFVYYFKTISFLLTYQSNLFTNEQINKSYDWLNDYFNAKNPTGKDRSGYENIYKKYDKVLFNINKQLNNLISETLIKNIYSAYNPEINLDEKKLINEFVRYDFPKDLSETLDKIDTKISTANDGFDYKNCMDLMRSFTERLFQSVAIEIDHKEGKKLEVQDSEKVARFFTSTGLLSGSQAIFLTSMRHFLSNSGSHKLKSPPEECRLSRNILIEFSLFLIGRLRQLKSK